jgi:hypothetical protein
LLKFPIIILNPFLIPNQISLLFPTIQNPLFISKFQNNLY